MTVEVVAARLVMVVVKVAVEVTVLLGAVTVCTGRGNLLEQKLWASG